MGPFRLLENTRSGVVAFSVIMFGFASWHRLKAFKVMAGFRQTLLRYVRPNLRGLGHERLTILSHHVP